MIVFPSSYLLVSKRLLSSYRRSTRQSWKRVLAAKRWASAAGMAEPKPMAQPSSRVALEAPAASGKPLLPPPKFWSELMASFSATSRCRACSNKRIRASGYLARTGMTISLLNIMQWHCVAAVMFAVRRSNKSRTQISPKRSFSSLPKNSPHAVTSTAPFKSTYISSQRVSPSWMMTRPGLNQYEDAFMANSATKSCKDSSFAKNGTFFNASH
mmetsp:Transcript_79374/g.199398  ORF Transcript_79374/g.199398 Transcript_79374/m.199398 type:complete len:213 (-) Transcript_79374:457-1095(-)